MPVSTSIIEASYYIFVGRKDLCFEGQESEFNSACAK